MRTIVNDAIISVSKTKEGYWDVNTYYKIYNHILINIYNIKKINNLKLSIRSFPFFTIFKEFFSHE